MEQLWNSRESQQMPGCVQLCKLSWTLVCLNRFFFLIFPPSSISSNSPGHSYRETSTWLLKLLKRMPSNVYLNDSKVTREANRYSTLDFHKECKDWAQVVNWIPMSKGPSHLPSNLPPLFHLSRVSLLWLFSITFQETSLSQMVCHKNNTSVCDELYIK